MMYRGVRHSSYAVIHLRRGDLAVPSHACLRVFYRVTLWFYLQAYPFGLPRLGVIEVWKYIPKILRRNKMRLLYCKADAALRLDCRITRLLSAPLVRIVLPL